METVKITIQGHPTRGKEIIQILESLGGINRLLLEGHSTSSYYYINDTSNTIHCGDSYYVSCKKYTLEEFEKEFPFKIGDKVIHSYSPSCIGTVVNIIFDDYIPYRVNIEGKIYTCATMNLKPYKEMKEERNITLTLDKAKEWYKKGGELKEIALQAFSETELNPLPRSWEEFCKQGNPIASWKYSIPTKYEALYQLEQLRNCWWNGWEPEYNCGTKYIIKWDKDDLIVATSGRIRAFLIFPTREMAEEFLKCFRDLIEKAGDLI